MFPFSFISGGGASFIGLLDLYPNAAMAYSLRKLRAEYAGSAVRIRRSSDNAESDIGFLANGNFNSAAAVAFCGVGNGFITTWYDQSGNGRNQTETSAANQPQIVASGAIITSNGKPAISYDGVNDVLSTPITLNTGAVLSMFSVMRTSDNIGLQYYDKAANNKWTFIFTSGNSSTQISDRFTNAVIAKNSNIITPITRNDWFLEFANNLQHISYLRGTVSVEAWASFSLMGYVGAETSGFHNEVIIYTSNQDANRAAITTLINQYYGTY
jgi:hypothetical protein